MPESIDTSLVRIHTKAGGAAGAGFLVGERHILTCAHVIAHALGLADDTPDPPSSTVSLDFPQLAAHTLLTAEVVFWYPVQEDGQGDIAGLELLDEPPVGAEAVHFAPADQVWEHSFRAFGFPSGFDDGVWTTGRLLGRQGTNWIQIEDVKVPGFAVRAGFSGAPVWDEQLQGVVGMIVASSQQATAMAAFVLPPDVLTKAWPELANIMLPPVPRNPYKGLRPFTAHDVVDFFGRDTLINELAVTLEEALTAEEKHQPCARLLAVVGPSGSGKSSVVMAGLLPRLREGRLPSSEQWVYLDPIVPGTRPIESLTLALSEHLPDKSLKAIREDLEDDAARGLHLLATPLSKRPGTKVVLLVDQFEELFTLTPSEDERRHFLDLLVTATTEPHGPVIVLLTLRADFYDRPMQYPELFQLIDNHHVSVLPLEREDLRKVIEQPANLPDVQLTFESGLVDELLMDMQGQRGALPLLEFTLDQLFQRRNGHQLTLQAYREIGSMKGALSWLAEETYVALPTQEHRRLARALFLRLIDPGVTEQAVIRRRAALSELSLPDPHQSAIIHESANAFIAARLLMTNQIAGTPTIEVSHQALIQEWPRLVDWLHEAREDLHLQQIINQDAAEWERRGKPKDWLYRGAKLTEAQAWMERNIPSRSEAAFLEASAAAEGSLTQRLSRTWQNITGRLRTDRSASNLQSTSREATQELEPLPTQPQSARLDLERVPTSRWYLHLDPPAQVTIQVGQEITLTLRLTADERPGSVPLRIPISVLEVAVYIEVPGFHLEGEHIRSIPIVDGHPVELNLPLRLIPVVSGDQAVRVLVYPGNQVEGLTPVALTLIIPVAVPVTLPDIPELVDRHAIPNPQPEVILYLFLEELRDTEQVRLHLTCPALGLNREPLEPLPLTKLDLAWMRQAVVQMTFDACNAAPSDVLGSLRAIGTFLFDQLMPHNHHLRSLYWHIWYLASSSSTPWSWLVVSDELTLLPWEMVCPYRRQGTAEVWYDDFLADQFVVAHWVGRQGLPLRAEAPLGRLALDHYHQHPHDLPRWHSVFGDEAPEGREELPGHLALMQPGSPYYGLHVLRYADATRSDRITYGGEDAPSAGTQRNEAEAMLYRQRLDFTLRRPVLGLSLIHGPPSSVGVPLSQRDTQIETSWLVPFMHAGATALVGPRWSVPSEVDQLFFRLFYQSIHAGSPLGWAVGAARAQVKQAFPYRADWLAYTYFGHPWCQPYPVRPAQGFTLFEVLDHPAGVPFEAGQSYRFRASYRTDAPLWFEGRLRLPQTLPQEEDISVMVAPLTGIEPEIYPLKPVPAGNDYQCIVTLTMPQEETTLPVLIQFQKGDEELRRLVLKLVVMEGVKSL